MLVITERFTANGVRYSLYEGERWLLFRERAHSAECVGSILTSGLGFIVTVWAKPGPMVIVPTLDDAVRHLVTADAPSDAADDHSSGGRATGGDPLPWA